LGGRTKGKHGRKEEGPKRNIDLQLALIIGVGNRENRDVEEKESKGRKKKRKRGKRKRQGGLRRRVQKLRGKGPSKKEGGDIRECVRSRE